MASPKNMWINQGTLLLCITISRTKIPRWASPLAYWPVYTAPTPKGKTPPRMPATVGLGPAFGPALGVYGGVVEAPNPAVGGGGVTGGCVPCRRSARQLSQ